MFSKILVANRGEIAVRAFRAATELGAKTVAVFPHEDRKSEHRLKADESYQIGEEGHPVRAYLDHDNIVRVYDVDEDGDQAFIVMELVEGGNLVDWLDRNGPMPARMAVDVAIEVCQALMYAHDKGVIHRDIKPGNLMVTSRGAIKIADFGIALVTQDFSKKLTSTGEFVGTPGYLSPEVCLGKPVDQRSDIFSLGIVLFEMLTGKMPFNDDSPLGLMLEVVKAARVAATVEEVDRLCGEVDEVLKPAYDTGKNAAEMCAEYYKQVPNCCELSKKQYLDMNMWLPGDILLKADKMCMAHSLELRVPFLDKKVMEFAEHIPANYRVNEEGCKLVLRHAEACGHTGVQAGRFDCCDVGAHRVCLSN